MKLQEVCKKIPVHIPYTLISLGLWLIYSGSFFLFRGMEPVWEVVVPLDHAIPYCEWFVIPYVMWYAFFFGTALFFVHIAKKYPTARRECVQFMMYAFGGCLVASVFYIALPTVFPLRPDLLGETMDTSRPLTALVTLLWDNDPGARNVFPSTHCQAQFCCAVALMRSAFISKKTKRWLVPCIGVLTLAVVLSTLFIRQHSILDALGAAVIAVVLYYISYKINWRFLPSAEIAAREDGN